MTDTFMKEKSNDEKLYGRGVEIKHRASVTLDYMEYVCPPGRELELAKTKMEEAVMWAVKSLYVNPPSND